MKQSVINSAFRAATACFARNGWTLPPRPKWDITDFGLGDFEHYGSVLVNLATEPEYCEKLMWATRGQTTVCHCHANKKEDIICRAGELTLRLWPAKPTTVAQLAPTFAVPVDGELTTVRSGEPFVLAAGSRVTLVPGVWHEFFPSSAECVIGEVSTANDDLHDNLFLNPDVGRFPGVEADEPAAVKLVSP